MLLWSAKTPNKLITNTNRNVPVFGTVLRLYSTPPVSVIDTVKTNCSHLLCFDLVLVHLGPRFYVLALMRHDMFLSLYDIEV